MTPLQMVIEGAIAKLPHDWNCRTHTDSDGYEPCDCDRRRGVAELRGIVERVVSSATGAVDELRAEATRIGRDFDQHCVPSVTVWAMTEKILAALK